MSNETKWAPGPWRCDQRQIIAPRSEESRGGLVATCRGSGHTRSIANANARLIAAAPELYDCLQAFPGFNADPEQIVAWTKCCLEVEAKARGEN
ncbi:hypothetical protein PRZ61_10655 [Halomonas pacifica]|uniref:Uncharacterized protein n=1 Tax=Bisbaumannia pacifica TaxID=77098 RepID=A0A510XGV3_9GAMM|nr:hypothetical protein [Halomonas pacifica]MDC8803895.1 hypothetical protein [Halomonas pacifica]GEK49210.1 hypothetical protein HPA02_34930 [Halomonas pacifica]